MKGLKQLIEVLNMPKIGIVLGGQVEDHETYHYFTGKHPKMPFIGRKTIGVGLIPLYHYSTSHNYNEAVNGKNSAAYFSRKAQRSGYSFSEFNPNHFINEIHDIHFSSSKRQGMEMDHAYKKKIIRYPIDNRNSYYAVFKDANLVTYLWTLRTGELLLIKRIMGHSAYLKYGVMYMLVTSVIKLKIDENDEELKYIMYDTMLGASDGLRMFKERCGFQSYRVKWIRG